MPILSLRTSPPTSSDPRATLRDAPTSGTARRHICSHSMPEGARELTIQHQGSEYHLRLIRNDRLIVTK
jgi:hemin uptake protein HemP